MKRVFIFIMLLSSVIINAKVVSKEVNIKNGYYDIPAIYTYDDEMKNQPLVVMMHGSASNKDEVNNGYVDMANSLIKNGISSIRFDFIGTGDSKVNYLHYTITTATNDANKVIEYARNLTNNKIGLLGWSQGGSVALLVGENKEISTIVTWAGALDLFDEKGYKASEKEGFVEKTFEWRSPLKYSHQWYEEVKNLDFKKELEEVKVPVLAIAGLEDDVVNHKYADKIVSLVSNKESKVLKIKNADHIFYTFDSKKSKIKELIDKTTKWYVEKLK